jgi:mono/diheme cytochrome c family protein
MALRDRAGERLMRRLAAAILAAAIAAPILAAPGRARSATPRSVPPAALPILGTRLSEFPSGEGKVLADKACLQCHGADLPRQQRLTEKQWTAEVEKMMRWGAELSADDKNALIGYLSAHFGSGNDAFVPLDVAPLSESRPAH